MTANQIAYNRMLEEGRTHRAQEEETHRANVAAETERSRANTLNYNASMYASQVSARNAEIAADTQRYAASLNYASSVYATEANVGQRNREMWANVTLQQSAQDETRRHNAAMEKVERERAETGQYNAGTNFLNAITGLISVGARLA